MNRTLPFAALFLLIGLLIGCGKEVEEPPLGSQSQDTVGLVNKDSLIAQQIAGSWYFEGIQNDGGVEKNVSAWVAVAKNGVSADTIETYSNSGGVIDNPRFATSRSWKTSSGNIIFTKTACQKRDNAGIWGSISCSAPLDDTLAVDSILSGKPIVLRGPTGKVVFRKP